MTHSHSIGIIGGTGLLKLADLNLDQRESLSTPWGEPSAPLSWGSLNGFPVVFLPRHGEHHHLPPHRINYRANIWALQQAGVRSIIAVAAVGGITPAMKPCRIAVPSQLVDYTHGRSATFFEDDLEQVTHIDFTHPYTAQLRQKLVDAGMSAGLNLYDGGVYGCTQGPRLETAAEIHRLEQDGCDLVGMTGMPEAALARELNVDYACCAVVANWAAGKSDSEITMGEIEDNLRHGMADVVRVLAAFVAR